MLSDLDFLNSRSSEENKKALTSYSPYDACENSHAIAIITEWDEFVSYEWEENLSNTIKPAKVFDGRNILDRKTLQEIGFEVYSIGKAIPKK